MMRKNASKEKKQSMAATGGGGPMSPLSSKDQRIAGMMGATSLTGIIPEGDSDLPPLELSPSNSEDK